MNNVAVIQLAEGELPSDPNVQPKRLQVTDNIGEGVHIYIRNVRIQMTVEDFIELVKEIENYGKCE